MSTTVIADVRIPALAATLTNETSILEDSTHKTNGWVGSHPYAAVDSLARYGNLFQSCSRSNKSFSQ